MNFVQELKWRGMIQDMMPGTEEQLQKEMTSAYLGIDPTADSLHIGHLVGVMMLRHFQRCGHKPYALIGGATGMIGDPSGKSKERNLQGVETLKANTECIKRQLERFIDLSDPEKGMIINNYDWFGQMNMIDFLRDYGKYFPVNYMLSKDIVASRLQSGVSFTEFAYMILQSVDFLKLHQNHGVSMQIGGGDQWGNLTSGLELIRKIEGQDAKVGCFTVPLLLDQNGKKFGKSEGGALYLDANLVSPYKIYQYFINVSDDDAARYMKVFSFKSLEEIAQITKEHYDNLGARIAQKSLAYEIIELIHGHEKAEECKKMSEVLFSNDIKSLSKENIVELFGDLETEQPKGMLLEDLLIAIKAASSKREAREFIKGNSVAINGEKVNDLAHVVDDNDALFGEYVVVKRGKKNYYLVKFN